ncbi:hypothetical protein SH668x_001728 [Planctomicrobium sp. SH668]|uniref:hypothetical protein n=1 Tax=Planctomicrobium sp. SH668 TaxID=3448126 RepID=UPI003F5BAD90
MAIERDNMNDDLEVLPLVTPDADQALRGLGGLPLVDERTCGQDLRLIRRAIRNDWPVSPQLRASILTKMSEVLQESPDPRCLVAAAKVVVAADRINVAREALDMRDEHKKIPDLHLHADNAHGSVIITLPDNGRGDQTLRVVEVEDWYGNDAHERTRNSERPTP